MNGIEFVERYVKANTFTEKFKCIIAKLLNAKVVTPLGRIVLLPQDYERLEKTAEYFSI